MVIETKTMADPGIEIEIGGIGVAPEKAPNPEAVPKIDTRIEGRVEMIPEMVYQNLQENIFFRLEEAHSSEQRPVSLQKLNILLLRIYFDTLKQTGWEIYIYI